MDIITIFLIAIGLSMDAFAVSIASGFTAKQLRMQYVLKIAFFFGLFQAIMPLIGWSLGYSVKNYLSGIEHWIAFLILSGIGIKMIYEAKIIQKEEKDMVILSTYALFILAIATSIDALAVGLSLSAINISIITPSMIIGIVTFMFCIIGVYVGNRLGHLFESEIEVIGGIILIGIGIKILLDHLGVRIF